MPSVSLHAVTRLVAGSGECSIAPHHHRNPKEHPWVPHGRFKKPYLALALSARLTTSYISKFMIDLKVTYIYLILEQELPIFNVLGQI